MKKSTVLLSVVAVALVAFPPRVVHAQGTAFTYQGFLLDNAAPASGTYDLEFSLFGSATGGVSLAAPVEVDDLNVTNGLFTTALDFGAAQFTGAARWVEIGVRPGASVGGYTALVPRQAITPVPYSIFANGVSAAGITGTIPAGNIGSATITSNMLAPGTAAANLASSGQAGVPTGGTILSANAADTNLTGAGYAKLGKVGFLEWEQRAGGAPGNSLSRTAVWTGAEMIVWGGDDSNSAGFRVGARFNLVSNTWTTVAATGAPALRYGYTAIWTGSEMIIWGGSSASAQNGLNDGGRYNPITDTWTPIPNSLPNTPAARYRHTAVWTGNEMIVWGGYSGNFLNDGGRYNPSDNSWTPIPSNVANTPAARVDHTAVWTGNEMIVWGGYNGSGLNDGGRYDPAVNSWTSMSSAPSGRRYHTAVWTGSEMIVWGGLTSGIGTEAGRYSPAGNSWTGLTTANAPASRFHHTAVWTGSEMIVWGGDLNTYGSAFNDGGRYNPAADTWNQVTTTGAPPARTQHTAVWTGGEMIVSGGGNLISTFNDTWSYAPSKAMYLYLRP